MEYLKFETAFHNARVNLSTKIYQTPFYGVVEEMVHFKCTIPKLLTSNGITKQNWELRKACKATIRKCMKIQMKKY
jgi:hypothetical protein